MVQQLPSGIRQKPILINDNLRSHEVFQACCSHLAVCIQFADQEFPGNTHWPLGARIRNELPKSIMKKADCLAFVCRSLRNLENGGTFAQCGSDIDKPRILCVLVVTLRQEYIGENTFSYSCYVDPISLRDSAIPG
jgi:hypothetical protein